MQILAALLLQPERPDLTLNYFIIAALLILVAGVLMALAALNARRTPIQAADFRSGPR